MRVGEITLWGGNIDLVPPNSLPLFGQRLAISQFPELFRAYGTKYGGDGVASFDLPDARNLMVNTCDLGAVPWQTYAVSVQDVLLADALGNGTILGYYEQFANTVLVSVALTFGSTTGGSGGPLRFTLPVACRAGVPLNGSALVRSKPETDPELKWMSGATHINPADSPQRMRAFFTWDGGFGNITGKEFQRDYPAVVEGRQNGDLATFTCTYPAVPAPGSSASNTTAEQIPVVRAR